MCYRPGTKEVDTTGKYDGVEVRGGKLVTMVTCTYWSQRLYKLSDRTRDSLISALYLLCYLELIEAQNTLPYYMPCS